MLELKMAVYHLAARLSSQASSVDDAQYWLLNHWPGSVQIQIPSQQLSLYPYSPTVFLIQQSSVIITFCCQVICVTN